MTLGFIGIGKMGSRMVEKLLADGHDVIVWNRTKAVVEEFEKELATQKIKGKFNSAESIEKLYEMLPEQKIIWMMLPAGSATESLLEIVKPLLQKGDILVDGANAYFADTQKRFDELEKKGILFLGIGVSGGIKAIENGYPMMVGGNRKAFDTIEPLLQTLHKPHGGYEYFGEGGAGHFIKMVHNGIEYGMMQAIGEGFGVIEKAPYKFDLIQVSKLWQKSTIVTGYLMECAKDALVQDKSLSKLDGVIDATGEALWTVEQGKKQNVYVENIEQSLDFRRRSQTDTNVSSSFAARMVAALRQQFGGHAVKKK